MKGLCSPLCPGVTTGVGPGVRGNDCAEIVCFMCVLVRCCSRCCMRHMECVCAGRCRAGRLLQSGCCCCCCIDTVTAMIRPIAAQPLCLGWDCWCRKPGYKSLLLVRVQLGGGCFFPPPPLAAVLLPHHHRFRTPVVESF